MKTLLIDVLSDLLISNSSDVELLDDVEKDAILRKLHDNLLEKSKSKPDQEIISTHLWHFFSYKIIPHLDQHEAVKRFQNLYLKEFFILTNTPNVISLKCKCDYVFVDPQSLYKGLKDCNELHDIYIFHPNYRWLFIITHEEEFGPYLFT